MSLVFLVAVISRSFGRIGTARKCAEGDRKQEWFLWSLGAALLAHVIAFCGISYFDQMQVAWYAFLAMISAATATWVAQEKGKVELESADSQLAYMPVSAMRSNRNPLSNDLDASALGTCRGSGQGR